MGRGQPVSEGAAQGAGAEKGRASKERAREGGRTRHVLKLDELTTTPNVMLLLVDFAEPLRVEVVLVIGEVVLLGAVSRVPSNRRVELDEVALPEMIEADWAGCHHLHPLGL